jgi:hypothetical protein
MSVDEAKRICKGFESQGLLHIQVVHGMAGTSCINSIYLATQLCCTKLHANCMNNNFDCWFFQL